MIDRKLLVLMAFVVALSLGACGGGNKATPTLAPGSAAATSAPESTATTQSAETEVTAAPTAELAPTQAEEADLNLDSVSSGIEQLASYKSSLAMRFIGTDADGQAVDNSWVMEEHFIAAPAAQHIIWSGSEQVGDAPATASRWEMITIGEVMYMISTDAEGVETCMMLSSSDSTPPSSSLTPDMWGGISDARYLGTDTVNGVRAKHYAWKEGALGVWGATEGQAETWVAIDGGYVVRQTVEATGKGVFMAGTDETGTTTWEWNVTEANGTFTIEAPAGCESAAADMPIMADAADKGIMGDLITYTSASPFADVVSFYKAEMLVAGWEATDEPMEMDGIAQLTFSRDGNIASLMITWDEDNQKTNVLISVTKP